MLKRVGLVVAVTILGTGVASAQGFLADQIQILKPGFMKSVFQDLGPQSPCESSSLKDTRSMMSSFLCQGLKVAAHAGSGVGALGDFYQIVKTVDGATGTVCTNAGMPDNVVYEVQRRTESTVEAIVQVPHCVELEDTAYQTTEMLNMAVDNINGSLYLATQSSLFNGGPVMEQYGIVKISGLPTLLDIIPTFQPAAGTLSWITPKHPEALPAADRFQVYVGDVRAPGDLSGPVPFDCSVPDTGSPEPGEYISILDSRPDPPVGEATYVIIGVEHEGERRFGRQQIGGVLAGRDPLTFTGCS